VGRLYRGSNTVLKGKIGDYHVRRVRYTVKKIYNIAMDCYTIHGMVKPFLVGSTIVFFGEKMQERGFIDQPYLLSFYIVWIVLSRINEIGKYTLINRDGTPKHMSCLFVLCHAILSIDGKGGVCH